MLAQGFEFYTKTPIPLEKLFIYGCVIAGVFYLGKKIIDGIIILLWGGRRTWDAQRIATEKARRDAEKMLASEILKEVESTNTPPNQISKEMIQDLQNMVLTPSSEPPPPRTWTGQKIK